MSEAAATTSTGRRDLFEDEHEAFRESFRVFCEREVARDYPEWRREGIPRELFGRLAGHQFAAAAVPEEHGGAGIDDFRFGAVLLEEAMRANATGLALLLLGLNEVCVPLLAEQLPPPQREQWLPGLATGELVAAFASASESLHVAGDKAEGSAPGVLGGGIADLLVLVAGGEGDAGPALVVVPVRAPGVSIKPSAELVGPGGCDRADLSLDGVELPAGPLAGDAVAAAIAERTLVEQLGLAVMAVAGARHALAETIDYVHDRRAFGRPIAEFENTRIALGGVAAEIESTGTFVDACVRNQVEGRLTAVSAASAKLQATELFGRAVDWGVQLHGGYGYMLEYPIAHAFSDARFLRLHGGSSERMKGTVADSIGL